MLGTSEKDNLRFIFTEISISYQKDLLSIDTRIFTPSLYLPLRFQKWQACYIQQFHGFFYEILIHSDFNFSICIVSFFVCSGKNHIFCRVAVFWALCLWSFQQFCFFNFFINLIYLLLGQFGIKSNNPFFCYLELFNFSCFGVLEFNSNSSTRSLVRYKSIKQLKTKIQEDIY